VIQQQYWINGQHYSLTLEAWLRRQDAQRARIMPIMKASHPSNVAPPLLGRQDAPWTQIVQLRIVDVSCRPNLNRNCQQIGSKRPPPTLPCLKAAVTKGLKGSWATLMATETACRGRGGGWGLCVLPPAEKSVSVFGREWDKFGAGNVWGEGCPEVVGAVAAVLPGMQRAVQVQQGG